VPFLFFGAAQTLTQALTRLAEDEEEEEEEER